MQAFIKLAARSRRLPVLFTSQEAKLLQFCYYPLSTVTQRATPLVNG